MLRNVLVQFAPDVIIKGIWHWLGRFHGTSSNHGEGEEASISGTRLLNRSQKLQIHNKRPLTSLSVQ